MKKLNENGIAYLLLVAIIVVVLAAGAVAYRVVGSNNDDTNSEFSGRDNSSSKEEQKPKEDSDVDEASGFDVKAFYDKVQVGMSYDQVRKLAGKDPEGNCPPDADCIWSGNCMDMNGFPEVEMTCYWSSDIGRASINFNNGKVTSKALALE